MSEITPEPLEPDSIASDPPQDDDSQGNEDGNQVQAAEAPHLSVQAGLASATAQVKDEGAEG